MATELLEKALKSVGGLDEFKRKRDQFSRDLAFINENRDRLVEDYNETWVAVYESKIVAYGKNYNKIISQLLENSLPTEQIPIRYLSKSKVSALYISD